LMFDKAKDAVKAVVPIDEYAAQVTELKKRGQSWRGPCPIHGGNNPDAFAVFPSKGKFRCFNCDARGDVIDLCKAVEGHSQLWTAMISLAQQYNVELPQRGEGWCRWQKEKGKIRDSLVEVLANSLQRRYFRVFGDVILEGIEDPEEREAEAYQLFKDFRKMARTAAIERVNRRG
jgi:DNA primase